MKKYGYVVVSALAATLLFTGCNEEDNRVTNSYTDGSGPLTEVEIPPVDFAGVLRDMSGNPIAGHTVYIGEISATTDTNGIFVLKDVPVKAGVNLGADNAGTTQTLLDGGLSGTTTVSVVIPSVLDENNVTTHLGATATISVEKYLAAVYNSEKQSFYTTLKDKTFYTGEIKLNNLGATVTGFAGATGSQSPISGTIYFRAINPTTNVTGTDNTLTLVSTNDATFTASASSGLFTATGLPLGSNMIAQISGYETNSSLTTWTNDGNQTTKLLFTRVSLEDQGRPEFSNIVSAYGDGNYTTGTTLQVGTFISASDTLTLKFTEAIESSKVSASSVRYVKTYTDEYLQAWELVNDYEQDKTNALNTHLATISDFRDANATFASYLNTHSGADMNISSANFKAAYQTYYTALKAMYDDANTTYGSNEITAQAIGYFKLDNGIAAAGIADDDINVSSTGVLSVNPAIAGTVTAANILADYSASISNDFGLLTYDETETGLLHAAAIEQMNGVDTKETYHAISSVAVDSADNSKVTITLGAALPSSNVVTIGLVVPHFTDTASNLLTNTRTGSVDLVNDDDITYVLQIAVGTI